MPFFLHVRVCIVNTASVYNSLFATNKKRKKRNKASRPAHKRASRAFFCSSLSLFPFHECICMIILRPASIGGNKKKALGAISRRLEQLRSSQGCVKIPDCVCVCVCALCDMLYIYTLCTL